MQHNISDSGDAITPAEDEARARERAWRQAENGEKAAQFLATAEDVSPFTVQEEKAILRRIDQRVLIWILGAYFFQQLDKSTLSYVSIFGLAEDAHLHGSEYSWLGSILYLAQLVMQPLAAFLLVKAPTGKVLGAAILLWGSCQCIMAACKDFPSLLGLRLALGSFESMIGQLSKRMDSLPGVRLIFVFL